MFSLEASIAHGVFNMGNDEDSVSSMGSSNSRSRNKHRLDGITQVFEFLGNFVDGDGLFEEPVVNLVIFRE
jgi:hypothetical protein